MEASEPQSKNIIRCGDKTGAKPELSVCHHVHRHRCPWCQCWVPWDSSPLRVSNASPATHLWGGFEQQPWPLWTWVSFSVAVWWVYLSPSATGNTKWSIRNYRSESMGMCSVNRSLGGQARLRCEITFSLSSCLRSVELASVWDAFKSHRTPIWSKE